MRVRDAARLAGQKAAWKTTRSVRLGRPLVEALGSDDESVRAFAGMLLTRAGRSAEPLLLDALRRRRHVPEVLTVLAGIGDETAEQAIRSHLDDPDPEVVRAATSAEQVVGVQRLIEAADER